MTQPLHLATSRHLEYFSEKELVMQAGIESGSWAILLLKELIDNALDACESVEIPPQIVIDLTPDCITVADNGPGIPDDVVARSLNYSVRVSDKSLRVAPTRGQLGNALKFAYAAPFVLEGGEAHVEILTATAHHDVRVTLDRIAQAPKIDHQQLAPTAGRVGTTVNIYGVQLAGQVYDNNAGFYHIGPIELIDRAVAFNPHAMVELRRDGEPLHRAVGLDPSFSKWHIGRPASPWWYTVTTLGDLVAGHLANGHGVMYLRDFLAQFHGLKGTKSRSEVLRQADLHSARLDDLHDGEGELRLHRIAHLLDAMQDRSRPVKAKALGVLGKDHLSTRLEKGYKADPLGYHKVVDDNPEAPFIVEVAVGLMAETDSSLLTISGLNHTPAFGAPFSTLGSLLSGNRIDSYDKLVVIVHMVTPRFTFSEHGKGRVVLTEEMEGALLLAVEKAAKPWTKAKADADKRGRVRERQLERLRRESRQPQISMLDSCRRHMEAAYRKASAGGRLPANARQIMYAIRPRVIADCGKFFAQSATFTQHVLPNFIRDNPELSAQWDVVYDARGRISEPHTGRMVDLGTLSVRNYLTDWHTPKVSLDGLTLSTAVPTCGHAGRFAAVLFVEKEGFGPLLKAGQVAERYDIAIMSTKGMSVTAARELVQAFSEASVPVFVIRDLDKAGFSIVETLRSDTRRFQFDSEPLVFDLGLRLADAEEMELEREAVTYRQEGARSQFPGLGVCRWKKRIRQLFQQVPPACFPIATKK